MVNRMMESDSLSVADQEPLGASFGVLPSVALDHSSLRRQNAVPRRKPVLIVDDDISLSRSLERLLTAYGFEAEVFNSAETFCEYADLEDGLCLALDINLRGRSGLDLKRQLTMSGAALPVIFI